MTTAAELHKLVNCPGFKTAQYEWARLRDKPIDFNQWQKGTAELREAFECDPEAKKDVVNLSAQVLQSWHESMEKVHGTGWRGKLKITARKKKEKRAEVRCEEPSKTDRQDNPSVHDKSTDDDVLHHVPDAHTKPPQVGDPMIVLKKGPLELILRGLKTLEIRHNRLCAGIKYLAYRQHVWARVHFGVAYRITTTKEWRDSRDKHCWDADTLPYHQTWGIPILKVEHIGPLQYRPRLGQIGTSLFRPLPSPEQRSPKGRNSRKRPAARI